MAEVRPIPALHYDLRSVGSLGDVTAPPYDVIDEQQRAALLARSPFSVVEIDLPKAGEGSDPYTHAADTLEEWTMEGIVVQDREPSLWALSQDYTAPDGSTHTRHGIFARVRVEDYGPGRIRPHERTQPGPKQDRLDLTRATRHNLSAIFALSSADAWPDIEPALSDDPWGEVTDDDGTVHRVWQVTDPDVHEAVAEKLASAELLIADGHHRYETARTYADEIEGDGPHRYTLICITGLDDPGLTVFPTHRVITAPSDPEHHARVRAGLEELFDAEEVGADAVDPAGEQGVGVLGLIDGSGETNVRLRLRNTDRLDQLLADKSDAYRSLDAVVLETLILKDLLGMSNDDIAAKRGIGYAKSIPDARELLSSGPYDWGYLLRPTPVDQVREVAAAGETMPPKSTYFFPKLLSGIVFNPLS